MIELKHPLLSVNKQAAILRLNRSSLYYKPRLVDDSVIANHIHEIYIKSSCRYGYRKITAAVKLIGIIVNSKKVRRIMKKMKIQGLYPRKRINTSISNKNQKFPYLLKGLVINKPNQVWTTDITYISLPIGFIYLVAIIDLHSRYIISYEISISLEAAFCCNSLTVALKTRAKPEIFNSDQGVQYTSFDFICILQAHGIKISMDGKGRCFDNIHVERLWRTIKQEDVYYQRYQTVSEAKEGLAEFISWYNYERLHQSLGYKTPYQVYAATKSSAAAAMTITMAEVE